MKTGTKNDFIRHKYLCTIFFTAHKTTNIISYRLTWLQRHLRVRITPENISCLLFNGFKDFMCETTYLRLKREVIESFYNSCHYLPMLHLRKLSCLLHQSLSFLFGLVLKCTFQLPSQSKELREGKLFPLCVLELVKIFPKLGRGYVGKSRFVIFSN